MNIKTLRSLAAALVVTSLAHPALAESSKQVKQMNESYASIKERLSKPGLDLATTRDIVEDHFSSAPFNLN